MYYYFVWGLRMASSVSGLIVFLWLLFWHVICSYLVVLFHGVMQSYGMSPAVGDHTVYCATWCRWMHPTPGIYLSWRDRRLSWYVNIRPMNVVVVVTDICVVVDVSEFLAKESNELFWSFVEEVRQFDLESPQCESVQRTYLTSFVILLVLLQILLHCGF